MCGIRSAAALENIANTSFDSAPVDFSSAILIVACKDVEWANNFCPQAQDEEEATLHPNRHLKGSSESNYYFGWSSPPEFPSLLVCLHPPNRSILFLSPTAASSPLLPVLCLTPNIPSPRRSKYVELPFQFPLRVRKLNHPSTTCTYVRFGWVTMV